MHIHPVIWSVIATFGLLGLEHYALRGRLHPVAAYTIGVVAVLAPLTIAMIELGLGAAVIYLWTAFAAGGAAVVLFYGIDWLAEYIRQNRELRQKNALLKKQRDIALGGPDDEDQ
ncbi:MAG TPA: hypothetical protein PKD55_10740 [Bellilinea sp.]|nr:hypothetical protein [Bellilinea sp.]